MRMTVCKLIMQTQQKCVANSMLWVLHHLYSSAVGANDAARPFVESG